MKISPVLVAAVAGKDPAPRGSSPRIVRTCGGTITDVLDTNIQSFGYPGDYSNYLSCHWKIQHDCAQSFTIVANAFDLEGQGTCGYDKLKFSTDTSTQSLSFCGGPSYSGNYQNVIGDELISTGGINGSITIAGNQLFIDFTTDHSVTRTGFDLDIQVTCDPLFEPTSECYPYPNFNGRATAYYNTEPGNDIAVPFSDFSQSLPYERPCSIECIGTAGCFKVFHDTTANTCELRGDELAPVAGLTRAIDGKYCDGDGRVWTDAVTETRVYCLFYTVESADRYLDYLNQRNTQMLDWITVKRVNDGSVRRDRISSTSIWSFEVAADRTSSSGTWYTFHSVTYYREFLPNGTNIGRRRRQVDDEEIFRTLSEEAAADFVETLDIGDTGAQVLETEDPVIETEILEEVVPAPAEEFRAAFDEFETVMRAAFDALPWQPAVPMLAHSKMWFEWFPDFADAPCANPAGQGPGAGDDYLPAVIDTEDLCGTVFSFHDALFGFYDDFVCLDRSAEADGPTKYRMRERMPILLAEMKVIFNRFLTKLSCPDRILIN